MADVVFLLIVLAFFTLAVLAIAACARIVGHTDVQSGETEPRDGR